MLRLSDAYQVKEEEPRLDLAVVVLNINPGNNKELLDDCQTLADFSAYSDRVRTYAKDMELRDAVEWAVTECNKFTRALKPAVDVGVYGPEFGMPENLIFLNAYNLKEGEARIVGETVLRFVAET